MNEYDSVQPAYENGPKEVNTKRRMPQGDKQFGKEDKTMPQNNKVATKKYVKKEIKEGLSEHNKKYHHGEKPFHRHKEHR